MRCGAVIPAAGVASRFGDDKTLISLHGKPALIWGIEALLGINAIEEIVVATGEHNRADVTELIARLPDHQRVAMCAGGATRMASVRSGVFSLSSELDLILIHDAARPLVTPSLIEHTIATAGDHGAAIPGVPATDTIKHVADNVVVRTLDRRTLVAVQTPQVFRRDWLLRAYQELGSDFEATDEASLLEALDLPVRVVPGDPGNIKITNPIDLDVARAILARRVVA